MFLDRRLLWCLVATVIVAQTGCYQREVSSTWQAFAERLGQGENNRISKDNRPATARIQRRGWAILMGEFDGHHHRRDAEHLLRKLALEAYVPALWIRSGDTQSQVLRGIYLSTDAAQIDLDKTRTVIINGSQPYQKAQLVSLSNDGVSTDNPYDLKIHSGSLSLQIGFFDENYGAEFRQAAVTMVEELRRQGDEAYFYHGPNMSMVTVGLFVEKDRIQRTLKGTGGRQIIATQYSARVQELRSRYPYNFANGNTFTSTNEGGDTTDESFLVRVP